MTSPIEALLDVHIRAEKLPRPVHEFPFLEHRKFRFDRAWPQIKFAVEVDGHVHRIKSRFDSDREKHALALLAGWTVLHVTGHHIRSGQAITWLKALLWERLPLMGEEGSEGLATARGMSENGESNVPPSGTETSSKGRHNGLGREWARGFPRKPLKAEDFRCFLRLT